MIITGAAPAGARPVAMEDCKKGALPKSGPRHVSGTLRERPATRDASAVLQSTTTISINHLHQRCYLTGNPLNRFAYRTDPFRDTPAIR
jgi:hypothetical protein